MSSYRWGTALVGLAVLVGLYVISVHHYLLFHTLVEGFSIAVACGIFMVAWNARRFLDNNYILLLGIAFLFIAGMDMVHTLAYKGMTVFADRNANLPTQLWIATRYMQAFSLLIAPFFIGWKVRAEHIFTGYAVTTALLLLSIFYWKNFPVCFVEGQGLTVFKTASEYVISMILVASAYVLYVKREAFEKKVLNFLYGAIFTTIASELAFTLYANAYGFSNLAGHYLKITAFYLIYKAVIQTGLREPYSLLFRNLKESEDRFRSFSEATFEGIIISREGKILDTNKQAAMMFGYESPSDIVGNIIFDLAFAENREIVKTAIREESEEFYEATFLKKDGSKFDAEVHGRMFDYHGRRVRVAAIRDVTEQKRTEDALRGAFEESTRREEEVEALLKGARAVLQYRDFETPARAIFDSCKALTGATAGYMALLSKDDLHLEVLFLDSGGLSCTSDPSLPMPMRGLRGEAYRSCKVVYENDFANSKWIKLMPEGHVELRNVLFAPLVIEGKVVGLMGIANKEGDFTDDDARLTAAFGELAAVALQNSRALESLEESEERFRAVAQSASDAIISSDWNGKVVFWNESAEIVFGYSADEAIGKPLTMIMPGAFRQAHEDAMTHAVSTGELRMAGKAVELTGLKKDGTEFPIELSLSRWKTGEEVFFSAIIRDVTKRKQEEEELEKYREHLEDVVKERTKELLVAYRELEREMIERAKAEAQLRQSQKMEAVGQLAGGIAHDFNNRLFAIRNYAHILKTTTKDGAALETIEKLIASCDKSAQLVDDLLKFSREKAINPKPIDVNVIVREARSILEIAAGKEVEFTVNLYVKPLQVMADASNMEHVLLNLVNNARDAMPEGGTISVNTERVEADAVPAEAFNGGKACPCALISVSDTGAGLQEGTEDKIFDPFFTTKEIGKGTGLGLSIVYGVVKQHGGFVDVASEPGKGTTFRIFLPLLI